MHFFEWFKKTGLGAAMYLFGSVILLSAGLTFYFKSLVNTYEARVDESVFLRAKTDLLERSAAAVDRAARDGRMAAGSTSAREYADFLEAFRLNTDSVKYHVRKLAVSPEVAIKIEAVTNNIQQSHRRFLEALQHDDSAGVVNTFHQLPVAATEVAGPADDLREVLNANIREASQAYAGFTYPIAILQIVLVVSIPMLFWGVIALRKYRGKLLEVNREIDDHNRRYVFDSMEEIDYEDAEAVKNSLLNNLKRATDFIQRITSGDYDVRWEGTDLQANKENIAGELIRMREQMKSVREQDEARRWAAEGLSMFGEIIRKHQDNFDMLADGIITSIVKYVRARVGGLFILEEEESGEQYLQLRACYAYDRKKYITKRIDTGEGLVGQAYLEGQTIYLTEVPDEYMLITSGLGDTNPRCLLIIPLKTNEKIEGVLELASLHGFKPHEIEFIEKLAETLASSIVSVRTAERTKGLLQVSQEQSEEMRAQEEEMRQNMEELEATQEQMGRQVTELNKLKESLEEEKYLFSALMDNLPEAIYFKDRQSRFIRVSQYMGDHFGVRADELIGKSDFDFQDEAHAREAMEDEQNIIRTRQPRLNYVEKETLDNGEVRWVSTTKMPLVNQEGQVVGTFGVSRDVTQVKRLEQLAKEDEERLKTEERQYEQKIGELEKALKAKEKELADLRKGV